MHRLSAVVFFCLIAPVVAGENWPQFRGPQGDGTSDDVGLPLTWSEAANVDWKTAVPGSGWSSPVVWGDQVWVTTANETGTELSYLVIDAHDGTVLHKEALFDVASPREKEKFNSYASPTPALDEERAYLCWGSPGLACVDRSTFETVWVRRDLECHHYRGSGSSPILFDGMLVCHYDGFDYQYVIALDPQTGETIWRTDRPFHFGTDDGDRKKAYATPQVIEIGGRLQLISPTSLGIFSYDPYTGEELWRARFGQFSTACRPVYDGERVFISTGFPKAEMLALDPTGSGDVTETHIVWREPRGMPSKPSPLVIDGLLYLISDDGIAHCREAVTGEPVWRKRLGGNYSASPVFADGRIYIFSEEGTTHVLKPGLTFELLAENLLDDGCLASPAVADGALFVRSRTHLYRLEDD